MGRAAPFPEDHPALYQLRVVGTYSCFSHQGRLRGGEQLGGCPSLPPLPRTCASAGQGRTSTKCRLLRPSPVLVSLWLRNSARALEMKCYLEHYQLLHSMAAIHTEEMAVLLENLGTQCATAATHPKWQGGKDTRVESVQGMRPLCKGRN